MSRSPFSRTKRLFIAIASAAMLAMSFATAANAEVVIEKGVNDGKVADGQTRADASQCNMYKDWYNQDKKSGTSTNPNYYKDLAAKRGCNWAQRTVVGLTQPGKIATQPVGINPGPITQEPLVDSGRVTTPVLVLAP
jgi:hypothetical protein